MTFRTGNAEDDDPEGGDGWRRNRQVRAEVLVALLSGAVAERPGQVGAVYLQGARVTGKIELPGGTFRHLLRLEGCHIAEGVELSEATTQTLRLTDCHIGPVRMLRANINGILGLRGSHLVAGHGLALDADGLTVTAGVYCDAGFRADGGISLLGASVGGLYFDGAHLAAKDGAALEADGLIVAKNMSCDAGFRADGGISLLGASVGRLYFNGAHLAAKDGAALKADGLTVTTDIFCRDKFRADGGIRLIGARVGGQLDLDGAHLVARDGLALNADGLTVTKEMYCREFRADGGISLANAEIGTLIDDKESWPETLELGGLAYGDLTYLPARDRKSWLNRSSRYQAQPYEQLAAYYRKLGHDEEARRVLLAKERKRTDQRAWWTRWWGWAQDAIAGYGYAPGRALFLLAGAFLTGWVVFRSHHPAPVGPGPHATFNAALYTLDVLIPVSALGQASDWDAHGAALAVAAGLHILGWLLAIAVIAAITRTFSRS